MKWIQLIYGVATFIPGLNQFRVKRRIGKNYARYCYSVWLRHLVMAKKNGLDPYPGRVAELGPGASLGIGLAALISGCDKLFAFDVEKRASIGRDLAIFDELVTLFKSRADIPGDDEFPQIKPYLGEYDFPADILNEDRLRYAFENKRLEKIRDSITDIRHEDSLFQYTVPWYDADVIEKESVDMIYSQAALEHVDDLLNTYKAMYLWLKPSGYLSHQIDYKCHGTADEWNGHWSYSDFTWKLLRGRRPYFLNRAPHSFHISILKEENFKIVCDKKITSKSNLDSDALAPKFKSISFDDLTTSGAFIQAVKTD